ncbi:MAG: hypothetical protein OER90_08470 [Gemmatimonadota bacterium]|nr:hypothetical protein [Gemmatimonadota bacterium]
MTRPHPFEHAFGHLAANRFPAIRDEAQEAHRDTADFPQFSALRSVQHLLSELESPDVLEQHPEAAGGYAAALLAAFRFWNAGCPTHAIPRHAFEGDVGTSDGSVPHIPGGACYLRLPYQLFWARIDEHHAHEPVDGLFVLEGVHGREVVLLLVLGLREDRPGFSQIIVTAVPTDLTQAAEQARKPWFAPVLDGGDAAGLKSLVTEADVLLLTNLALRAATNETEQLTADS